MITLDTPLLGPPDCSWQQVRAVIEAHGPAAYDARMVELVARSIVEWAGVFAIRPSILAGQINHETNYLRFGGDVQPIQLNFAGLGATGGVTGHRFATIDTGIIAVCAHHLTYILGPVDNWPEPVRQYASYDPRYGAVISSPHAGQVAVVGDYTNGRWAYSADKPAGTLENGYARAIVAKANEVLNVEGEPMTAQIPGFAWQPAESNHYRQGRSQRIRGGAQHYTAGTNSLNWLSRTSDPPVSVHFLVKHEPTIDDRGWQLVRIEDTSWTTADANPYTVAIEYEHQSSQAIPDSAYEVLAQTWADITRYVADKGLGAIETVKGHKEWVGNPQLVCPDGIDVPRIVARWRELTAAPSDGADPVTGKHIAAEFRAVYDDNGGLTIFGHPVSGAFLEDGRLVQYFERAEMQHFPENSEPHRVLLRLLGAEELARRYPEGAPA